MKRIVAILAALVLLCGCLPALAELNVTGSMELEYAKQFTVDYIEGGYALITNSDGARFLTIPEGAEIPADLDEDIVPLQLPLSNLLISSTPTVSLINAIGALDAVTMTTQEYSGWYIDEVKAAMDAGKLSYIGSYKEPDFEVLTANPPPFSVFSTMLDSVPDVAEKLKELGIPYLRDTSTYETHPLGRMEWVKLYGLLLGKEKEAQAHFEAQKALVDGIGAESTGKTVAMFYITSKGDLYTRKAGDYMVKMLRGRGVLRRSRRRRLHRVHLVHGRQARNHGRLPGAQRDPQGLQGREGRQRVVHHPRLLPGQRHPGLHDPGLQQNADQHR